MTCSTVHSRKIPKIANFLTCSLVPPFVCLYINPPSLLSLESHQHDSGRQFPVCWGKGRRRYFLRPVSCWTKCSASAQSQEPRGQLRRPLHSETCHKITETRYTWFNIKLLLLILTTYWNVCFLHNAISPLLHWGNYELSIFHFFQGFLAEGMYPYSFNNHVTLLHAGLEKSK